MSGILEQQPAAATVDGFLAECVAADHFCGAEYVAGPAGAPRWTGVVGDAAREPAPELLYAGMLHDLASLTKPLATAAIALRLAVRGRLDLDAPLDRDLPELVGYAGRTPSLADLLTHRAGLPAWAAAYRLAAAPAEVPAAFARLAPHAGALRRAPLYGCTGPLLAGIALERASGATLRQLFADEVRAPLGLAAADIDFGPLPDDLRAHCVPTEHGRAREAAIAGPGDAGHAIAPGPETVLRGVVHDGNAMFFGGAAGNAGLFGTARALHRLGSAFAAPSAWLPEREWRRAVEPQAGDGADVRTLGWQSGCSPKAPRGSLAARSIGHVGFTGSSLWIDLEQGLVAVLCAGAVHPHWRGEFTLWWRRAFHERIAARAAAEFA